MGVDGGRKGVKVGGTVRGVGLGKSWVGSAVGTGAKVGPRVDRASVGVASVPQAANKSKKQKQRMKDEKRKDFILIPRTDR